MDGWPAAPPWEHSWRREALWYSVVQAGPILARSRRSDTRCCGPTSKVYTHRRRRDPPRPKRNTSRGAAPTGRVTPLAGVHELVARQKFHVSGRGACGVAQRQRHAGQRGYVAIVGCAGRRVGPGGVHSATHARQLLRLAELAQQQGVVDGRTVHGLGAVVDGESVGAVGGAWHLGVLHVTVVQEVQPHHLGSASAQAPRARGVRRCLDVAAALAHARGLVVALAAAPHVCRALLVHELHLHVQLEAKDVAARRVLEGKVVGRGVEQQQQVRAAGRDA
ncbi:hypothetical protein E2C01_055174 [Portunus trituberculatus]|uniref:Uncharacterized protein n=1 Tax=Portunus trituberculatus TaxID=210409 RepID=A0A5B7GLW1_PORTR|nr:hypothetical protein [Portunus trituberculatus]